MIVSLSVKQTIRLFYCSWFIVDSSMKCLRCVRKSKNYMCLKQLTLLHALKPILSISHRVISSCQSHKLEMKIIKCFLFHRKSMQSPILKMEYLPGIGFGDYLCIMRSEACVYIFLEIEKNRNTEKALNVSGDLSFCTPLLFSPFQLCYKRH